jgi:hypothetical protein
MTIIFRVGENIESLEHINVRIECIQNRGCLSVAVQTGREH